MVDSSEFSAKSAYYMAYALRHQKNLFVSTEFWCCVWRLKLPLRVHRHFWRACENYLPTRENLPSRGVLVDPQCPACGLAPESTLHLYRECTFCWLRVATHESGLVRFLSIAGGLVASY